MNAVLAPVADMTIAVGDTVRCLDFPDDPRKDAQGCYNEGVVEEIGYFAFDNRECQRYRIRVTSRFWQGKMDFDPGPREIFPPVNGTEKALGGICHGVIKL